MLFKVLGSLLVFLLVYASVMVAAIASVSDSRRWPWYLFALGLFVLAIADYLWVRTL